MSRREFFRLTDPDDEAEVDALLAMADLTALDMGQVLTTIRPWPSNRVWAVVGALLVGSLLPLLIPGELGWGLSLTLLIAVSATALTLVLGGAVDRHRICEHGLVLGWRTRSRYVVPWSTVDPARVRVVERSSFMGRRDDTPASSPHFRTGLLVTRALSLNGIDTALGGFAHLPGYLGVSDAVEPGSLTRSTPFVNWLLGARDPAHVARAIEDAMVADGYAAHGLAERAVAERIHLPWNPDQDSPHPLPYRGATEPPLGV